MFEVQNNIAGCDSEFWCVTWKNNRIVTGSIDGKVRIWDNDLVLLKQLASSPLGVISVATNGFDVASSSMDGKLRIWNMETGELKQDLNIGCGNIWQIKWQPESSVLAYSNSTGGISRLDTITNENLPLLQGPSTFVTALAYSPDGKFIASGNREGVITIFDVIGGIETVKIEAHVTPIRCISFSYSNTILSGAEDKLINIFDIFSGKKLGSLSGHSSWLFGISCSPNSTQVASCSADKTVKIWSLADNSCLTTLHHHTGQVLGVEWGTYGDYLVSISEDKSIISYKCISK